MTEEDDYKKAVEELSKTQAGLDFLERVRKNTLGMRNKETGNINYLEWCELNNVTSEAKIINLTFDEVTFTCDLVESVHDTLRFFLVNSKLNTVIGNYDLEVTFKLKTKEEC